MIRSRYWRWQAVRNLPVAFAVCCLVAAAGMFLIRFLPNQQTAVSRVVLETPLTLNGAPRAARSAQDIQHLQIVVHTLLSHETRSRLVNDLGLIGSDAEANKLEAEIKSGRDKPTILIIKAHSPDAITSHAFVAAATQEAITIGSQVQRERVEASLKEFETLVAEQEQKVRNQQSALNEFGGIGLGKSTAQLEMLETQAKLLGAELATASRMAVSANPERAQLEARLSEARSVYSNTHPKVRLLVSQLAQLRPDTQIGGHLSAIRDLEGKLGKMLAEAEELRSFQARYLETEDRLIDAQISLDEAKGALSDARLKGERSIARLKLIQDSFLTTASYQRKQLAMILLLSAAALALAFGAVALRIRHDRRLRRPADLTRTLGLTPFATIPHLGPSLT